jgi:hypothetical protein
VAADHHSRITNHRSLVAGHCAPERTVRKYAFQTTYRLMQVFWNEHLRNVWRASPLFATLTKNIGWGVSHEKFVLRYAPRAAASDEWLVAREP